MVSNSPLDRGRRKVRQGPTLMSVRPFVRELAIFKPRRSHNPQFSPDRRGRKTTILHTASEIGLCDVACDRSEPMREYELAGVVRARPRGVEMIRVPSFPDRRTDLVVRWFDAWEPVLDQALESLPTGDY